MNGKMIGNAHSTKNKKEREYLRQKFPNDYNILSSKNKKFKFRDEISDENVNLCEDSNEA